MMGREGEGNGFLGIARNESLRAKMERIKKRVLGDEASQDGRVPQAAKAKTEQRAR